MYEYSFLCIAVDFSPQFLIFELVRNGRMTSASEVVMRDGL